MRLRGLLPSVRRARALVVGGVLLVGARTAHAQGAPRGPQAAPRAIAVELESGCVTAGEFVSRVKARTARAREARAGEAALQVRVTIEGLERIVGRLVVTARDALLVTREVEGATCEEVIDALALVLAVTLDPLVEQRHADGGSQRDGATSPPVTPPKPPPVLAPRRAQPGARARSEPRRAPGEVRWRHLVGGEATLSAGLIDPLLGGLGARYAASRETRSGRPLLLTLGAFATFAADARANHPTGGLVRYRLQALDAGACPFGVAAHRRVRLYPCAGLTLGRFQAEGVDLPGRRADAALFAAAGLAARATVEVFGPVGLMGAVGLSVPLGKYSAVVVGADESAGEVHPLGIVLAFGVTARLP